jgi:enoyl-CoA hydratase
MRLDEPTPGTWVLTLDRPDRLNALTFQAFGELEASVRRVAADPTARCLVVTGSGRGFCAGLDLEDAGALSSMPLAAAVRGQDGWARAITCLREVEIPVIAAVNGPAAGAGFSLALAADLRIAARSARFNAAFVRIGLTGGDCGSSWMLPRIVGLGHAYELLLTGRLIDAVEAERIGLVNRVVADEDLLSVAIDLAGEIAANSPLGVSLTKRVVQDNVDAPSLRAAIELENRNQVLAMQSPDMSEALSAFREKRAPRFASP